MRVLRRRERIITPVGMVGASLLVAAGAPIATAGAPRPDSQRLWATVNVCDTERWPDTIGIRGSMPGREDMRETMWMRFQVQFRSPDDGRWHDVPEGGDSGFVAVGRARARPRQAGRSFRVSPRRGEQVVLRGKVFFQWRRGDVVTHRASARTHRGHRSSAGADPPSHSASTCTITPDS